MEDAVLIDPDFYVPKESGPETRNSTDSRISLFGVFDGHGGRCVSRFVVKHFSSQFRAIWKEHDMSSDISLVLSKTFLKLDEFLREKSNTKELNRLEREGERHEAEMQNKQQESDDEDDNEQENGDGEYVDLNTLAEMQHLSEEQKKALFLNFMMQHANKSTNDSDDSSFEEDGSSSDDNDATEKESDDKECSKNNGNEDDECSHPAFHCGCTAVVAALFVMKNGLSTLYVANAGDSRCVLSRNGIAAEMSKDHKPTDPSEHSRIVNAGGCVTREGRIDGNLNLSRSFGDFNMKQNKKFGPKDQKVTVYPDVRMVPLVPQNDDFFVIACDGIWEIMSSQEVVTFVSEKLKEGKMSLGEIAESLCDACLSSDPDQTDCYGCDNMSVVIVKLDNLPTLDLGESSSSTPTKKRKLLMISPRILRPRLVSPHKGKVETTNVQADENSEKRAE